MMYARFGIPKSVADYGEEIEKKLRDVYDAIDKTAEYNQLKVIGAMQENRVSEACFAGTTGYGYNDIGRETLERCYASIFHTEDALVRPQITCGTHALALALGANLRPGDELLYISGGPYDTLEETIGIRPSRGSLAEYGVTYREVPLGKDGRMDLAAIRASVGPKTKIAAIQRSRGYQTRPSYSVSEIGEAIAAVRSAKKDVLVMVDNCYGEFVERTEPSDVGADMVVGSLIKNPGGGLAPIGGYIAGTRECIENAAVRLTSPGLGREVGATLGVNRSLFQGLFLAPTVTAAALKGAVFAANVLEGLGFPVFPAGSARRADIIQAAVLGSAEAVEAFCTGIQKAAPVDSFVTPEPWDMPGYDSPVIMAAGAFISGASIELSADAPMRAPYAVYFQGGLTYPAAKLGILTAASELAKRRIPGTERLWKN